MSSSENHTAGGQGNDRQYVDVTHRVKSACCGQLPYRVNGGPWRCGGCGSGVPEVREWFVAEAEVARLREALVLAQDELLLLSREHFVNTTALAAVESALSSSASPKEDT